MRLLPYLFSPFASQDSRWGINQELMEDSNQFIEASIAAKIILGVGKAENDLGHKQMEEPTDKPMDRRINSSK